MKVRKKANSNNRNDDNNNSIHKMNFWMETLMENCTIFCDENCGRPPSLESSSRVSSSVEYENNNDYAALHDAFLDSLLHEQQVALRRHSSSSSTTEDSLQISNNSFSTNSSSDSRKRRRGTRKHYQRASTIDLQEELSEKRHPSEFIHPLCRMQKDKGKGEPIGSKICAKGAEFCLIKLRDKMMLLTEHCLDDQAKASMKRKDAVTSYSGNFVETRSLLILKMGFLSMNYGILLRWDAHQKITLVVLRKSCHESFYSDHPPPLLLSPTSSSDDEEDDIETEDELKPQVTISILYATGLSKRSHWTVQLTLNNSTEAILLSYDSNLDRMVPKLNDCIQGNACNDLEIRLLEQRRNKSILKCTLYIPSGTFESNTVLRIPCPDGAAIQLEAEVKQPVQPKKSIPNKMPKSIPASPEILSAAATQHPLDSDPEDEEEQGEGQEISYWDWLCMVC